MLLRTALSVLSVFLLFNAAAAYSAPSDPRLLQLVPPESQIVAGMRAKSSPRLLDSFLVLTHDNKVDLEDFQAIIGADTSRVVDQIVFVAASGLRGTVSEHTVLFSGQFKSNAIFRFTEHGKASVQTYRNVNLLVVPPFAREAGKLNEIRWLAVLNSKIVIFGSPDLVREELDRWLAQSPPDSWLMSRLARLGSRDDAWCLMPAPSSDGVVRNVLEKLDPRLGAVATRGQSIEYGIHFAGRVEITASADAPPESTREPLQTEAYDDPGVASYFLPRSGSAPPVEPNRVMVKVTRGKYQSWLDEFANLPMTLNGEIVR